MTTKQAATFRGVTQAAILRLIRVEQLPAVITWLGAKKIYALKRSDVKRVHICLPHNKDVAALNPSGFCMCGCGEITPVYNHTNVKRGIFKGCRARFLKGHNTLAKSNVLYIVDPVTGCWNWNRAINSDGYAGRYRGKVSYRFFYEKREGPIADGLELDHLCRNRKCVNPDHLEPVTGRVNTRRSSICKITPKLGEVIKSQYALGGLTWRELAARHKLSVTAVRQIVQDKYQPLIGLTETLLAKCGQAPHSRRNWPAHHCERAGTFPPHRK